MIGYSTVIRTFFEKMENAETEIYVKFKTIFIKDIFPVFEPFWARLFPKFHNGIKRTK
jgi:hypothetical protein